ncbi:MAG: hypothetical protein FWE67_09715 [Planctomycetaceae bacterium]|nr:hypothetical protein [Planctomycetaceae bacterium]
MIMIFKQYRSLSACCIFLLLGLLCPTSFAQQKPPISADKAKMMGYVEDFFMNNARDITMRKSLEWGEVKIGSEGNRTIRYKFEALIWDKDRIIFCSDFTFDKDGKYLDMLHVEGFSKPAEKPDVTNLEGVKKLVEKFFSQNFRDITARKTIEWGELEKHEDGSVSLVYRYEATTWDEDIYLDERRFTFDKNGEYVSCDRTEGLGFPKKIGKTEKKWDISTLEAVKKQVERFFTQNYMDISARRTISWGELEKHEDGSVSLVYRYEATIRGKDKIIKEERFTFNKNGKVIEVKQVPKETSADTKPDPAASRKKAQEGWQNFMQGNAADAELLFLEAAKLDPKNANAYQGLGWAQLNQIGKMKAAKETFLQCMKLDPKNTAALNGLGRIAQLEGDTEKAIEYWTEGANLDPQATGPMAGLAALYDGKDDYKNAIKYYEMWLRAEPNNEHAKEALKKVKEKAAK